MNQDWSALDRNLSELRRLLEQPISAHLSVLPVTFGDEEDWLQAGTRALDQAVRRICSGVDEGIGPAVLAQPIDAPRLSRGFAELRQGVEELRGVVVMGEALAQSGRSRAELGDCLRQAAEHNLSQVDAWLAELRAVLADPKTALRERGLPTSGEVELDLTLRLEPSPALERLREMVRASDEPAVVQKPGPCWRFFKLAMAGLALYLAFQILIR